MAAKRKDTDDLPGGTRAAQPSPAAAQGDVTPSMAQFLEIKTANPDSLLWYRMGDFYELFFEDAVAASAALGIVLTKRGKHLGEDIPMCGVPIHRADEYLQRLIRQGYRVAVCEQLEDPAEARKRGSKAVVRRDVVRLVTPGTLTEDTLLDARARNYLTAAFLSPGAAHEQATVVLASLDISTGEFEISTLPLADLAGDLARLAPAEIIAGDTQAGERTLSQAFQMIAAPLTPVPTPTFDSLAGERMLKAALGTADLGAYGAFSRAELAAIGALLKYVELTQVGHRPVVRPPRRAGRGAVMAIDAASRASLELVRSATGERAGTLLAAMDRTVTGPGARELAHRIASPLTDAAEIHARLDAIAAILGDDLLRERLRDALRQAPDIARAVSRLALDRGSPRDLVAVRDGLAVAFDVARLLADAAGPIGLPAALDGLREVLAAAPDDLASSLANALIETPPHVKRDGGFVREGFRPALDEARRLKEDSRAVLAALEARYVEATGVKTLKVRHNNILGYFVEVTQQHARVLGEGANAAIFRHRQTMANAARFTTDELAEIEGRIASAGERALALELEIFAELARAVAAAEAALSRVAASLAVIDCLGGLAELAADEGYVRPEVDATRAFEIVGGRHPVVEQALRRSLAGAFIANDCVLGRATAEQPLPPGFDEAADGFIWLVTGPNMAGKSTYLRQNALIAIMAQMGSFVPAERAHIGIVDRLYSRVGASDDLARGRSTFMVEMVETAAILNTATERSLVILDEIGRGTATFDGLSIAWATIEHLHASLGCRTLFATHYHELTALSGRLNGVTNVTVEVKEWQDEIVFLHKVRPGAADRSYGVQVAKLAGLPAPVIARAGEVLRLLENAEASGRRVTDSLDDLPLFAAARPKSGLAQQPGPGPLEEAFAAISPDALSPREALDLLYRLKALASAATRE
ncbi:MAG: DNA mismatch repair protein MutS [Hyphomicrobiaceae bacterium]